MPDIAFRKMHGCGNDFVILDARTDDVGGILADSGKIAAICDRRFGVGCDQLIVIQPHADADAEMLIRNADGSVAGMCGNASRCVADILMNESGQSQIKLVVGSKTLLCHRENGMVVVDMGPPLANGVADVEMDNVPEAVTVDMGNPHAVFVVNNADAVDLAGVGPRIERHSLFPHKTNVEFISSTPSGIRMRVWERGAGVTLACGSGACASAWVAWKLGLAPRSMDVAMDGGTLRMTIRESDGHILMSGPASAVFSGTLPS